MNPMATPPNDDTKMVFKLLADRQWHRYVDVRDEVARKVPPGRALRRYEQDLKNSRKQHGNDPQSQVRKTETEMIEYGARSCVQSTLTSWKRAGAILQRGENNGREIKVRDGFTSWGIPGFEPGAGEQDSEQAAEGPPEVPRGDSERSEGAGEMTADVFAGVDVTQAVQPQPVADPDDLKAAMLRSQAMEPEDVRQFVRVPETGEWQRAEQVQPTRVAVDRLSPEGGLFPASDGPENCELCGLTVGSWARHEQWHKEQKQVDTPSDVALLNESQLRTLIRAEMGSLLDLFQNGVQGYLDQQFAQLEDHITASRRVPTRWMSTDGSGAVSGVHIDQRRQ